MLAGYADFGQIELGKRSQFEEQRAELNRFRSRSENEKDGPLQEVIPIVPQELGGVPRKPERS
jgi:hypothetical protein